MGGTTKASAAWRAPFLRALAAGKSASAAAVAAGVHYQTAFRARVGDEGFAGEWARALARGQARLAGPTPPTLAADEVVSLHPQGLFSTLSLKERETAAPRQGGGRTCLTPAAAKPRRRTARAVAAAADAWGANRVVAEVNQGGDMVRNVLKAADRRLPVSTVHARRGKWARAEPVAALFERGDAELAACSRRWRTSSAASSRGAMRGRARPTGRTR